MRVRTEEKRATIVQAASEVFLELGFEGASMSQIAARVGGSKRTLYGYFGSKEELFVAVAKDMSDRYFDPLLDALSRSSGPIADARSASERTSSPSCAHRPISPVGRPSSGYPADQTSARCFSAQVKKKA